MSHVYRFYVPPGTVGEGEAALEAEEAHHAVRVVRAREGDGVVLFDGEGREFFGVVSRADRKGVSVTVEEVVEHPRPGTEVTLVQGWLNREKPVEDLIRRGTELGISGFKFFKADRSERAPRLHEKWKRLAIESCKQCGRLWLPSFEVASGLAEALAEGDGLRLIATRSGEPTALREAVAGASRVSVLVGPEGDFSEAEVDLAVELGALRVTLGAMTLRSEVAGMVAAALVLYELGELGPVGP